MAAEPRTSPLPDDTAGWYERLYRRVLFPLYEQGLRRRGTLRHQAAYEANQWRSADELQAIQWNALNALLRHCQEQVPYYRDRWKAEGIDWRDIRSMADFQRLPLLTKDDIRAAGDRLVADAWRGRTLRKATGGSTGQPLAFHYTRESYERRIAVMQRGYAWAGVHPARRTSYVWGGEIGPVPMAARLKTAAYNAVLRRHVLNSFHLTRDNADDYLAAIDRYRPRSIVGYVAPLHLLARQRLARGGGGWRPESIVTGAEALLEFQRRDIEAAFGAPVFNTYGCREFMLIAAECPAHEGLHVNIDHLAVDLVDDAGRPADRGRVVVTDLHNHGMPVVRYANGDTAIRLDGTCRCGRHLPRLRAIEGRVLDIIRTADGHTVPGEFFPHLMKDVPGIERFQVIQPELARLRILIVRGAAFDESARAYIEAEVRRVLGTAIALEFAFVPEIPLTATGKLRVTVSALGESVPLDGPRSPPG